MARELGNFSNITNATDGKYEDDFYFVSYFIFSSITIVIGTICNLWFLCAIITSPDVRRRLRNQIISSLAVVHLIQTLLQMPIGVAITIQVYNFFDISCQGYYAYMKISLMMDFVANWILVSLLAVFIAQIYDYNPAETWTPLAVKRATAAIIVVPWLASFIIVIGTLEYPNPFLRGCFSHLSVKKMRIFRCFDTVVPVSISIAMLIAAAFLRHRRFSNRSSSGMRRELIGQGPQIDSPVMYIVSVTVAILTELMYFLMLFKAVSLSNILELFTYFLFQNVTMDIRVILMTFPWLLLPDIRERIKTWRPWYRRPPGIDLSVAYGKEHS